MFFFLNWWFLSFLVGPKWIYDTKLLLESNLVLIYAWKSLNLIILKLNWIIISQVDSCPLNHSLVEVIDGRLNKGKDRAMWGCTDCELCC